MMMWRSLRPETTRLALQALARKLAGKQPETVKTPSQNTRQTPTAETPKVSS